MKILKSSLFALFLLLFVWIFFTRPAQVFANPVCSGSPACVWKEVLYTYEVCRDVIVGGYPVRQCWDVTETALRCTIPQSGGGSCVCCYYNGCYLNCPGTNPPGGGDDDDPPDPPPPGSTPTPTPVPAMGNVRVRAVSVPSGTSTCAQVNASTSYIAAGITLYPPGVTKTTPVNGTYATWNNQTVVSPYTTYGFSDTPPGDYVFKLACWSRDTPGSSGAGSFAELYNGSTLTWQAGFVNGVGWWQAKGGDVHASATQRENSIKSDRSFAFVFGGRHV